MSLVDLNDAFEGLDKLASEAFSVDELTPQLIELADQHGFTALLYERFRLANQSQAEINSLDAQSLRAKAMLWEALAIVRKDALKLLLHEAQVRGLSIVLFKGAALAYQLYKSPGLRPSVDIDLYINEDQLSNIVKLLCSLGYDVEPIAEKSMICFQFCASKTSNTGHTVVLDVHYRINNQAEYEGLFEFSKVLANSVSIPEIDPAARGLCYAEAYVLACVHLQGHYALGEPIKGIWLYDIHLLLQKMNPAEQGYLVEFIDTTSVERVCARWTQVTKHYFRTEVPSALQHSLANAVQQKQGKLPNRINPVKQLWDQFYFLANTRARLVFLKQLFIPSKQRIRDKYPNSKLWMPILYFRRIVTGLLQRLAKIRN